MLTVRSTINIAGQTVPQIIPVVQGDTGRSILFTLADFTIPSGATANYYIQKPSGEAVYNAATVDGNTVLVELTAQSIIEAGDNYGQVRIENDGEVVTSFDFILLVKPFRGIDAVESTTEMNIFDKAVEHAREQIEEAAQEAQEYISTAVDDTLSIQGKAADAKATGDAINDLKSDFPQIQSEALAAFPTDKASGAIASFADGADNVPVKNLTVNIEPVQSGSGDPSPDNVRTISGWDEAVITRCAKNLLHIRDYSGTVNGTTITTSSTAGSVSLSGTRSANGTFSLVNASDAKNIISLKAGKYKVLCLNANNDFYFQIQNSSGTTIATATGTTVEITLSEDADIKPRIYIKGGVAADVTLYPMITLASEDDTFEPYKGNTYTIDLGGTIYGGSLDVTSGVLTVEYGYKDLGTLTWSAETNASGQFFKASLSPVARSKSGTELGNNICSNYIISASNNVVDKSLAVSNAGSTVYVRDFTYADAASFKTAMSGVQLVYKLATPQTYQLTAQEVRTLLGNNNIWSDTGDTTVQYRADTKLYIEKLTAPTEDDMVADHAISSGAFFMVGNSLYRATTAIASGATITVGTNATKLSLADALNTLS